MEPLEIFRKREGIHEWEFTLIVGPESTSLGFLVKIDKEYWEELTEGRIPPESLVYKTLKFLLKRRSKYLIPRSFDLRELQEQFPDYGNEMKV